MNRVFFNGPFNYYGNGYVSPSTVSAAPSSVSIINTGALAICMQIYSPIDATVDVSDVSINVTPCNQAPANIYGTWEGKYTCINYGSNDDINQSITLTINKLTDGKTQYVDDGGDTYEGTVCGNVFKFNRINPVINDTESGTFVLNNNGTGTKNSTWCFQFQSQYKLGHLY